MNVTKSKRTYNSSTTFKDFSEEEIKDEEEQKKLLSKLSEKVKKCHKDQAKHRPKIFAKSKLQCCFCK
jgi:hypothetical protein